MANADEGLPWLKYGGVTIRWQELCPTHVPPRTAGQQESITEGGEGVAATAAQGLPPLPVWPPPVMHPPSSIPWGLWAWSQHPRPVHSITLQPGQDPLVHRTRARCHGEAHPGIIRAFPTSSFILCYLQATSGGPWHCTPPSISTHPSQ